MKLIEQTTPHPLLGVLVHINDNAEPGVVILLKEKGEFSGMVVATEDKPNVRAIVEELIAVRDGMPMSGRWRYVFLKDLKFKRPSMVRKESPNDAQ